VPRTVRHYDDGRIEITFTTAAEPSSPFTTGEHGWLLDPADFGYLTVAADRADPAPLLVPVGRAGDAEVFTNLEAAGLISLSGDTADVRALLAGILAAVPGCPWAETARLLVPRPLADALPPGEYIEPLDDADAQLVELVAACGRAATALAAADHRSLAAGRAADDPVADTTALTLLAGLAADTLPEALLATARRPDAPLVVLSSGPCPCAQIWQVGAGTLELPGESETVTIPPSDAALTEAVRGLLWQAAAPAVVRADDPAPTALRAAAPPEAAPAPMAVDVLGPVLLGGIAAPKRHQVRDILVYLALHRRGVSAEQLHTATRPDDEYNPHSLSSRMTEARRLTRDAISTGRSWRMDETVGCDWQRFQALAAGSRAERAEAIRLIRGRPFEDYGPEWVHTEGFYAEIESAVVDLTAAVAEQALADDDPHLAEEAARAGLRVSPSEERLVRLGMRAAHARGATGQVRALMASLRSALDGLVGCDCDVEPETVEVYVSCTGGQPVRAAS
jgi:hypothetical protein